MTNLLGEETEERAPPSKRDLDKFYTKPEVAARCMAEIEKRVGLPAGTWIEPAAGNGAFLDRLPQPRIGIDVAPCPRPHAMADDAIRTGDFLDWRPKRGELPGPVMVVGNPPFGRNASLALKFVNHCVAFADYVCFILPRTFMKDATKDKVNQHFELIHEHILEDDAFTFDGEEYNVSCCFQIWHYIPNGKRSRSKRVTSHPDFQVVGRNDPADFTFQRVGGKAGTASFEGLDKSWKSHHRIKVAQGIEPQAVIDTLNGIDWRVIKARTAGNPSIGKSELFAEYAKVVPPLTPIVAPLQNYGLDLDDHAGRR